MITRIKNALLARHGQVEIPYSKLKFELAQILEQEKYIEKVDVKQAPLPSIVVTLRYVNRAPAITQVRRVSKPGRRQYAKAQNIPRALGGYGLTIVSTSQGVMSDQQARQSNVGGEVLCQIW